MKPYWQTSVKEVAAAINSNVSGGLTSQEAKLRLQKFGPNQLQFVQRIKMDTTRSCSHRRGKRGTEAGSCAAGSFHRAVGDQLSERESWRPRRFRGFQR
jgi:hypothetical protein